MRHARIENDIVAEVYEGETLPPFHPSLVWISNVGENVDQGWLYNEAGDSFISPEDQVTVDQARAEKVTAINALYQDKIDAGFLYDGNLYHLDANSRSNMGLMKLAIQAGDINPHGGQWIGKTGSHTLNDTQVQALANTAMLAYRGLLFARQVHLETLYASSDKAFITAYDTSLNWP